jgi:Ca-activated chloride channel homolog
MDAAWFSVDWSRPAWLAALAVAPLVVYWLAQGAEPGRAVLRRASLLARSLVVGLIALALADPRQTETTHPRQLVVFAVDQSRSIYQAARRRANAFIERARLQAGDRCDTIVLPFAAEPRRPADGSSANGSRLNRMDTNLAAAIEAAAAMAAGRATHLVLLSDGNETQGDALAAAKAMRLPISTVPLPAADGPETLVRALAAPAEVRPGETFRLEAVIETSQAGAALVELGRDGQIAASRNCHLTVGENRIEFEQTIDGPSAACFEIRVCDAQADTIAGNNIARTLVTAVAQPRVLLLAREAEAMRPFAQALTAEQFDVAESLPDGLPSLADLRAFDLLVLANVPANTLPPGGPRLVRDYVAESGGGLLVLGGDGSFGLGGYDGTPLADVLPLASDFRRVRETDNLALLLVIDHSGSMKGLKIEMAKDAAMRAVEAVRGDDLVGVLAFDGLVEWVSPGLATAADKVRVAAGIAGIEPRGGTEMFEAMRQAYLALADAPARRKQVILLTDGKSKPGAFDRLASQFAAAGMSISTVAMGDEADQPLLRRVADLGGGRYYFTDDPRHLPRIFSEETTLVTGMALDETPCRAQVCWQAPPLAGVDLSSAGRLLGHVLTRPKATSDVVLATERGEPLLAWWRYGLGMSVAFTSDATGRWGAEWIRWPDYGRFWSQIARHALRVRPTCEMRVVRHQSRATLTIDAIDRDSACLTGNGETFTVTLTDPRGRRQLLDLHAIAPGRLTSSFAAARQGIYRLDSVHEQAGNVVHRQTASLAFDYPDELRGGQPNIGLLRRLAEVTGGRFDPLPEEIGAWPAPSGQRSLPLWPLCVKCALAVLVIDVAVRRLRMVAPILRGGERIPFDPDLLTPSAIGGGRLTAWKPAPPKNHPAKTRKVTT